MNDSTTEIKPTGVPPAAKQVGDAAPHWAWTERSVWTERMLTALEQGVKGGKWFSLIDKVHAAANLASAFHKVAANQGAAGVDHISVEEFDRQRETHLTKIQQQLREGSYQPQQVRRVWIPKPGSQEQRPLGILHGVPAIAAARQPRFSPFRARLLNHFWPAPLLRDPHCTAAAPKPHPNHPPAEFFLPYALPD